MKQTISKIATISLCLSAAFSSLIIFIAVRHRLNSDLTYFFLPWFAQLTDHGWHAISGAYSDYTPPYLYLLATIAPLHSVISDVVLIKSVSMIFTFIAAFIVDLIVLEITMDKRISAVAGAGFLILPTVIINSAYWGQNDVIYSTFILSFVLFTLKDAPYQAAICFGVALSFKLQAILVGPYVLYLVLRKRIALQHLFLIPTVYVAAMVPAWLMGRPASELATIYYNKFQETELGASAPNFYELIRNFPVSDHQAIFLMGLILAVTVGFALPVAAQRFRDDPHADLLVATASVILMPFVLPEMHDRYFFLADVLTYVLIFIFPGTWRLAIAMQIGSLSAYCQFLFGWHFGPYLGTLAVSVAATGIVWMCFVHARTSRPYNGDIAGNSAPEF
jgi:Gpi18-like mannosyltransferase